MGPLAGTRIIEIAGIGPLDGGRDQLDAVEVDGIGGEVGALPRGEFVAQRAILVFVGNADHLERDGGF